MFEKYLFSISHYESLHHYGMFKHFVYLVFSIFRFIRYYLFGRLLYVKDVGSEKLILIGKQYMANMRLSGLLANSDIVSYSKNSSYNFTKKRLRCTFIDVWSLLRYCAIKKNGIEIFYESIKFLPLLHYTFDSDRYLSVIANDPADPFVLSIILKFDSEKITVLCETYVDTFSLEWTNVPQSSVKLPLDFDQSEKFIRYFGFRPMFTSLKLERACVENRMCNAPILFFHQYYHSSGFRSFTRHIYINILIGSRPGIRFRIHPNAGMLEKSIYRMFSAINLLMISDSTLDEDLYSSKFAMSIYSGAINLFKEITGRPAKYIYRIKTIRNNLKIDLSN